MMQVYIIYEIESGDPVAAVKNVGVDEDWGALIKVGYNFYTNEKLDLFEGPNEFLESIEKVDE